MTKYLLTICVFIVISCKRNESTIEVKNQNITIPKQEINIVDSFSEKKSNIDHPNSYERPKQCKIIKSKFDVNNLFGIWTLDPEGPHADFDLSEKSFYVVDYDGDGDMPYIINQDTIKVYYSDFMSVGIIKKATKDTLKIDWDQNGVTNYIKWKI